MYSREACNWGEEAGEREAAAAGWAFGRNKGGDDRLRSMLKW